MSNFFGVQKSNWRPLGPYGEQPVQKDEGEPAPRPDGAGERELGLTGQVSHANGDAKMTDLARQIVQVYRRVVAPMQGRELTPAEKRSARDQIVASMGGASGNAATRQSIYELASVMVGLADELDGKFVPVGTVLKCAGTAVSLFVPILLKNEAKREVHGVIAEEAPDKAGEVFDYASSKPHFQKWSADAAGRTTSAGQPVSYGNVRAQHSNVAAGKLTDIHFDDAGKRIGVIAKIVDDDSWNKVMQGVYTGFSIGGKYLNKWSDGPHSRYTAQPAEVSLVDSPCMPGATFSAVKSAPADSLTQVKRDVIEQLNDLVKLIEDLLVKPRMATTKAPAGPKQFFAQGHPDPNDTTVHDALKKVLASGTPITAHKGDVDRSGGFKLVHDVAPGIRFRSDGTQVTSEKLDGVEESLGKALQSPIRGGR
jgi:hypothetical protein